MERRATLLILTAALSGGGGSEPVEDASDVEWLAPVEGGLGVRHVAFDPNVGPALAVGTLDGDGLPEVIVGPGTMPVVALRNAGGLAFEDATSAFGLSDVQATALGLADLDGDGDADLIAAADGSVRTFRNVGGAFGETTEDAGLSGIGVEIPVHVLAADLDGDGLLDLHVSSYVGRNLALRATGDGSFEDVTEAWGLTAEEPTWSATWYDQDGDGLRDLYTATDTLERDVFGGPEFAEERRSRESDRLYRNLGPDADGAPRFRDVAAETRLDVARSSMGGLVGDFTGDGRMDLFVTDFGRNHLLTTAPDGTFRYRTAELGLDGYLREDGPECPNDPTVMSPTLCALVSWGATFTDLDHDGRRELFVVNGGLEPGFRGPQPPSLYRRGADGFEALDAGIDPLHGRALAPADLDGDGDLDLVVGVWNGVARILENRAPGEGHWLAVRLRGRTADPHGAGALVTVERDDGRREVAAIGAGGRAQSSVIPEARFGLGAGRATAVEVRWPSGALQRIDDPPMDDVLVVEESS